MAVGVEPLVVWINGAFGVGKTAVADELIELLPGAIVFDAEPHGDLLRRALPPAEQPDDFQDLPAWRELTRAVVASMWPVADQVSAELMARFYKTLLQDPLRVEPALSDAMRMAIKGRFKDPGLWAAYALTVAHLDGT